MNFRKILLTVYLLFLAGVAAAAALFLRDALEEYNRLKATEAQYRARLEERQAKLAEQETELRRLRSDPVYVEKVIRQNLRYAKPDEYLFDFEQ